MAKREDEIVGSEAFRAINLLIDEKAADLAVWMTSFKTKTDATFNSKGSVRVRTSREPGEPERDLPAHPHALLSALDGHLDAIRRISDEINSLQRYKLRLLNDYDFTHGDDAAQKAVFTGLKPQQPEIP